ncbi:MAG: hypothetical protein GX556_17750 [Fibrobacter sp.]|nr:hypothetical protein [Fibrobacter sp.]
MVAVKYCDLSDEIYHRLYRLIKRQVDPKIIATTLHLPLKTVLNLITRIKAPDTFLGMEIAETSTKEKPVSEIGFLDVYYYQKTRFALIKLIGTLNEENSDILNKELEKGLGSFFRATAIKMSEVVSIDEAASRNLLNYNETFQKNKKFLAILDPSKAIEPQLLEFQLEGTIPIFGTERAFEEAAFPRQLLRPPRG